MCCFAPRISRNGQFCISGTFVFLIFTTDLSFFYVFPENQATQTRIKYITRRRQHPRSPPNLRDARRRLIENSLATKATLHVMSLSMKQLLFPSKARIPSLEDSWYVNFVLYFIPEIQNVGLRVDRIRREREIRITF